MRGWKLRRRHSIRHGGTTSTCPTGSQTSGNGATLSIGSKAFAEEQLMAQMTADVLGAHGFTITDTFSAADKAIGNALTSGTIDMYWQYTGTELAELPRARAPDSSRRHLAAAFTYVQQKDEANGSAGWRRRNSTTPTASPSRRAQTGDIRHLARGLRHLPDVTSEHHGLHPVRVPHSARRSARAGEHVRLAVRVELSLHPDRHHGRKGDRQRAVRRGRGLHHGLRHRGQQRGDAHRRQEPLPAGQRGARGALERAPEVPVDRRMDDPGGGEADHPGRCSQLNAMVEIQGQTVANVAHTWLVQNGFLSS